MSAIALNDGVAYYGHMFIRKTEKVDRQTNKRYFNYQLVESYRTDRGPRQRILLNLGNDLPLPKKDLKLLANRIEEIICGAQSLFGCPEDIERLAQSYARRLIRTKSKPTIKECITTNESSGDGQDYQTVDINSLEHEHCRTVGAEYIALETLKKLKLDRKLLEIGLSKRQVDIATGVIIGRLVNPGSDRSTHNWLQNQSGLEDLLDTDFCNLSLDAVYKVADQLIKHKDVLEDHLASVEKDLFSFDDTIVLYDLTNTYFEGSATSIKKAKRGRSKEKRTDCPLVTLGLVLNKHGFPKRSDIFAGNASEPGTLKQVIERLNYQGKERPIIVLDAGFATEENLTWLRENQYRYIVSSRKRSLDIPHGLEFKVVRENESSKVEAAQTPDEKTGEVQVYCRSEARKGKEQSMQSTFQRRFEQDLQNTATALHKKRGTKDYKKVLGRIGRLKERHKRISSYYDIEVTPDEDGSKAIDITWKVNKEKLSKHFQGVYVLRTYGMSWTSEELWSTYVMLTEVEDGFRCMKSELGLRPIFHQIDRRVDAHLFITLLAYHIMQTIRHQLRGANMNIRWQTLRQNMSTQVRVTTSMRLRDGRQLHIRASTKSEPFHRGVYQALKLSQRPGRRIKTII